jgi:hypothetical protein
MSNLSFPFPVTHLTEKLARPELIPEKVIEIWRKFIMRIFLTRTLHQTLLMV